MHINVDQQPSPGQDQGNGVWLQTFSLLRLLNIISIRVSYTPQRVQSSFALNHFGSWFGCIYLLTAVRIYQAISLPCMLYGASLWNISKTELEMFEGCIGRSCIQSKASLQDGQKPVCFGWLVQEISRTLTLKTSSSSSTHSFNFLTMPAPNGSS